MKRKRWVTGCAAVGLILVMGGLGMTAVLGKLFKRVHGEYVDSNGVRIHYTVQGHGEPLILVHGFAVNADLNWRTPGVIDELAKDYEVIALDDRGHGLSDKPHGVDQYGTKFCDDIIALMDHLKIQKAHVVGYSMGGFITLKLITMYPDRLLSAAPCGAGWEKTDTRTEWRASIVASLEARKGFYPLIDAFEPNRGLLGDARTWVMNRVFIYMNDQKALADVMRSMPELKVTEEQLRANKVPTLSIVGTKDPLKSGVDNMVGVMANHEAFYLEGDSHFSVLRDRKSIKRFLTALKAFLEKHHAPQSARASIKMPLRSGASALELQGA